MTTQKFLNAIFLLPETHTKFERVSLNTLFLRKKTDLLVRFSECGKTAQNFQKLYKNGNELCDNELFSAASSH